jgi:hypothetical protein
VDLLHFFKVDFLKSGTIQHLDHLRLHFLWQHEPQYLPNHIIRKIELRQPIVHSHHGLRQQHLVLVSAHEPRQRVIEPHPAKDRVQNGTVATILCEEQATRQIVSPSQAALRVRTSIQDFKAHVVNYELVVYHATVVASPAAKGFQHRFVKALGDQGRVIQRATPGEEVYGVFQVPLLLERQALLILAKRHLIILIPFLEIHRFVSFLL